MKSSLINQQNLHFEELYALGAIDGEAQDHVVSSKIFKQLVGRYWKIVLRWQLETTAVFS